MDIESLTLTRNDISTALDYAIQATARCGDNAPLCALRTHLIRAEGRIRCELEILEREARERERAAEEERRRKRLAEAEAEQEARSRWGEFVDVDRLYLDTLEAWNEPPVADTSMDLAA